MGSGSAFSSAPPALFWFDRFDERIGVLRPLGPVVHSEELGGEDTLEFDCAAAPAKGDRLVWLDPDSGDWREHVVVRTVEPLGGPARVYAEWALSELLRDFVVEAQLVDRETPQALAAVLAPTRWEAGDVAHEGRRGSTLIYHMNALAALRRVESVWDCEICPRVEVSGGRVSRRVVDLPERRGAWRGLRFSYGRNMAGCTRTVLEDEVFTALYGFGKGLPVVDESGEATGGFTRRLTFADVNGGVAWVGDDGAREAWGRWDASRAVKAHAFGAVTFPECENAYDLRSLTLRALREAAKPKVSYEVDAALLGGAAAPELGDTVAVVDTSRSPAWRLRARVVARRRELRASGGGACSVTLGTVQETAARAVSAVAASVATVAETADAAQAAAVSIAASDLGAVAF